MNVYVKEMLGLTLEGNFLPLDACLFDSSFPPVL